MPTPLPPLVVPAETWTGFSVGVGGGVEFLNADVDAKASRTDSVFECLGKSTGQCNPEVPTLRDLFTTNQSFTSNINDLGETGGFFTVRGAYDYQFAPRWVAGAFVDGDWSDISASASQTQTSSSPLQAVAQDTFSFSTGGSRTTFDTRLNTDWSISVGGRIGWLVNPGTLLYFLAAYTHQDLNDARVKVSISDPIDAVGGGGFPNTPANLLVKLPDSLDGFSLGGGGEAKLGGPWSVRLEYRWTHLNGGSGHASSNSFQTTETGKGVCTIINFNTICGPLLDARNISSEASAKLDDLNLQTVRAELVYHFWTGGGG